MTPKVLFSGRSSCSSFDGCTGWEKPGAAVVVMPPVSSCAMSRNSARR